MPADYGLCRWHELVISSSGGFGLRDHGVFPFVGELALVDADRDPHRLVSARVWARTIRCAIEAAPLAQQHDSGNSCGVAGRLLGGVGVG